MNKETRLLLKKAQSQDKEAFSELMQLYLKDMYRIAIAILMNEEDSADALQEMLLSCWRNLHTLKKPEYFKTWLTRILINHCNDILRKRVKLVEFENIHEPIICDEYNVELKEAFASMDEKYRLPAELYYGQGYKVREIGKILKLPTNTVKTYLARGRKQLAEYYR